MAHYTGITPPNILGMHPSNLFPANISFHFLPFHLGQRLYSLRLNRGNVLLVNIARYVRNGTRISSIIYFNANIDTKGTGNDLTLVR